MVIKRQSLSSKSKHNKKKQNLCLDKAYHSKEIEQEIVKRGYIPHIRHRREEKKRNKKHPARRWVVERTNSWHNRFRKLFTDMKRKKRTILVLYNLQIVLLFTGG